MTERSAPASRPGGRAAGQGQLLRNLSRAIDLVWVGILFLLVSLPVFTAGAAASALYYAVVKSVRRERGHAAAEFFACFRANFRQGTLLWLICLGYLAVGLADLFLLRSLGCVAAGTAAFYMACGLYLAPLALLLPWLFSYLSRFENSLSQTIRNAALLAVRHLGLTAAQALILGAAAGLGRLFPVVIPLLPGPCALLLSLLTERAYRPLTRAQESAHGTDAWYNE